MHGKDLWPNASNWSNNTLVSLGLRLVNILYCKTLICSCSFNIWHQSVYMPFKWFVGENAAELLTGIACLFVSIDNSLLSNQQLFIDWPQWYPYGRVERESKAVNTENHKLSSYSNSSFGSDNLYIYWQSSPDIWNNNNIFSGSHSCLLCTWTDMDKNNMALDQRDLTEPHPALPSSM